MIDTAFDIFLSIEIRIMCPTNFICRANHKMIRALKGSGSAYSKFTCGFEVQNY